MNLPLFQAVPDCRLCERWQEPRNPGIPTTTWGLPGPGHPVLIVVGPSPSFHDHLAIEPYRGKGGRLMRDIALANLSTLCTIYFTLLVRCGPTPDAKARHYKSCHTHAASDLNQILSAHTSDPLFILLLGADATIHFHRLHLHARTSHKSAINSNGKTHQIFGRSIPVFSTLNPAAILRNNSLIYTLEDHIELLTSTILGTSPIPTTPLIEPARAPRS